MKSKKTALTKSLIALLLCIAMLIGTTSAWFTDSVTSGSNIIKTGKLDIEMYWTDDLDRGVWYNVEDPAYNTVFSYDKWEPGYTDVRYIKLVNKGNLALNYNLTLTPQNEVGKLAEVINVYFSDSGVELQQRSDLSKLRAIGLLNNVLNGGATAEGTLLASGQQSPLYPNGNEVIMTLAMSMITTAGNDYQNETSGDFTITALATQASFEKDSFGADYDTNAEYPPLLIGNSVSTLVSPVDGKVPAGGVTMSKDSIAAYVPAGVALEDGTDKLTLSVTPLANSNSGISTVNSELLIPVDVHIEGVAEENTVPIIIDLGAVLPKYLNMGNYHLFHVEDGNNVEMTLVDSKADLNAHNQFTYDPLTGEVTVAMATFSEVALVADTSSPWKGGEDYDWYTADATYFEIANADQLYAFSKIVGGIAEGFDRDAFEGDTVKLLSDINLNHGNFTEDGIQKIFYPIGYYNNQNKAERGDNATGLDGVESAVYSFSGTFDGNGNRISNFYQNTWEMFGDYNNGYTGTPNYYKDAMGLFGYVHGGTIKNLTVDHFESDGEFTPTGVIAAYAADATFENIAIANCNPRVYNTGNGGIVGIGGNSDDDTDKSLTFTNITIDNTNTISALWGSWDVACGGLVGMFRGNGTVDFTNCHVAAQIDVNNDVCANYQYYWYRYSGMMIGSVRKNTTEGNYTVADIAGITAKDCTYTLGTWNEYWYCELVANSIASYTHDHQFSRLTKIESVSDIKEGENWTKKGNFVLPAADNSSAECYHIFEDSEGNLYRHFHDVADETNLNIYETFDLNGDGELNDLKEDRTCYFMPFNQILNGNGYGVKAHYEFEGFIARDDGLMDSKAKFANKGVDTYQPGQTIKLGDLVEAVVDETKISKPTLFVAVSPATEEDKANATYAQDTGDWKNSTITLAGDCEGRIKIVISDYFYCTPTVIYLNPEQAAEKFTANTIDEQSAYTQITLGTIFGVKDGETIGNVTATVTDPNGNETTVTGTNSDWENKTINLTKDGTWTVAIKDDDAYCAVTSAEFTVNQVDKFTKKFDKEFLYRVGNVNTVALSSLFGDLSEAIAPVGVNVTVTTVEGNAAGTYTAAATWTNGTIQFTGTGVVTVTISADGANPEELNLEVVDAVNATSATSATANNVVLLKDCGFSSLEVSGGYTLYGNGFTMTCGSDSYALDFGYAFVKLENGTLDNVQVVCPNFDYAALYKSNLTSSDNRSYTDANGTTRYYNAKSGVMVSGNSQILNSRISGARAAVNVTSGNAVIDNSSIELGAVASILVGAANSVTLRDVTLVQKPTESTYDSTKTLMGFSVLLVCNSEGDAAPVNLEGTLVQDAWIDESDSQYVPSAGQSIISGVLSNEAYMHDLDGDGTQESLNLGFAYMPESLSSAVNTTTIVDSRTNKSTIPYSYAEVSILNGNTYVYSYKYSDGETIPAEYTNTPVYVPNKYSNIITVTYSDTTDGLTTGKSYGSDGWIYELNVDLDTAGGYALDFSKLSMTVNGVTVTDYLVDGKEKPDSPVQVTAGGTTYTLTATINGVEYTATYKVTGTETSKDAPSVVASDYGSCVLVGEQGTSITWSAAAPALEGIQIRYWSVAEKQYKTVTLSDLTPTTSGKQNGTNTSWSYSAANKDYTLTITNTTAVHSGNGVFAMPVVCDSKLYFVITSSSGLVSTSSGSRSIVLSYVFEDNNGGRLEFTNTWNAAYDSSATIYDYSDFCSGSLNEVSFELDNVTGGTCIAEGSMITMADGSKKAVEDVRRGDLVMAFDHTAGKLVYREVALVGKTYADGYYRSVFVFDDGTELNAINEHGIYDLDLNQYVNIGHQNYQDYIGHRFVSVDSDGNIGEKRLVDVVSTLESGYKYDIVTNETLTYVVEDTLSVSHEIVMILNSFEFGGNLTYDVEAMQADIEKYGLYTYEDFAKYCECPVFEQYNMAMMKVGVGKGIYTYEHIVYLLTEIALNDDVQIIN